MIYRLSSCFVLHSHTRVRSLCYWCGIVTLCCVFLSCGGGGYDTETHDTDLVVATDSLLKERKEKDRWLATSPESAIPKDQRLSFKGLNYFAPDDNYEVIADFTPNVSPETVVLATNTIGEKRTMVKKGTLTFSFIDDTTTYSLIAFSDATKKTGQLFIPFKDKTTGAATYGAGRYIDLVEQPGENEYILDFNTAYNPFCAYNSTYSCPAVPSTNVLPVAINAGEKIYHPK